LQKPSRPGWQSQAFHRGARALSSATLFDSIAQNFKLI
jgi:hypothetical protein